MKVNFLTKLKNKVGKELALFLSKTNFLFFLPTDFLFKFFLNLAGDGIYYENYQNKKLLLLKLAEISNRTNKINIKPNTSSKLIAGKIKDEGVFADFDFKISQEEITYVKEYFNKFHFYDSHTPLTKNRKEKGDKPSGAYASFDIQTQLNCRPILKLCLNEKIVEIAYYYLGCLPKLFSINTFKTLSGHQGFTHNFHRDLDDFRWLTIFIYWTDTTMDNGGYQQIKFTHRPSEKLSLIFKKNEELKKKYSNFDDFFLKTLGYGKLQDELSTDFGSQNIFNSYGESGKIVAVDTAGLHRGTSVKSERMVTWIRYGVTMSRQKDYEYEKRCILNNDNEIFFNKFKYKKILEPLIKNKH